jgi:hypothetical protein
LTATSATTTASTAVTEAIATSRRRRASARLQAARSAAIRSRARSLGCGPRRAPRADAREQHYRRHPAGRQARRRQRHPAAVGVPHEHRARDAARVQVGEDRAGVRGEPPRRKLAGAVSRAVRCHGVKLGGQPSGDLLPVGGRAGLPVQQHQFASAQPDGHAWPGNRTVPRRTGIAPGPGTPQPEHDQPSGQCDQPETGQAVKQHRRQGLAGTQPGGYQRQAERSLSDSEPRRA